VNAKIQEIKNPTEQSAEIHDYKFTFIQIRGMIFSSKVHLAKIIVGPRNIQQEYSVSKKLLMEFSIPEHYIRPTDRIHTLRLVENKRHKPPERRIICGRSSLRIFPQ
jgi:hypothetical protein